jgi:hypothetical protein
LQPMKHETQPNQLMMSPKKLKMKKTEPKT